MHRDGDERLPRPGRGRQDDVGPGDLLDDRLVLGGVQRDAAVGRPLDEVGVRGIRIGADRGPLEQGGRRTPPSHPARPRFTSSAEEQTTGDRTPR